MQFFFKQFLNLKAVCFSSMLLILLACEKETPSECENAIPGVLKDYTNLDGCTWLIQLPDSSRIEPINLNDFEIDLVNNKPVCLQFNERTDLGSYCMSGKIVEIIFIE